MWLLLSALQQHLGALGSGLYYGMCSTSVGFHGTLHSAEQDQHLNSLHNNTPKWRSGNIANSPVKYTHNIKNDVKDLWKPHSFLVQLK